MGQNSIFIAAGKRTPIGRFQGLLKSLGGPQLGAAAISGALASGGKAPPIQEVFMGQVLTAGVGQAPARQAALLSGISNSVPCTTVGKVCGSGLQSIILGAQCIALGEGDFIVAGGQESMSSAPFALRQIRDGWRMGHKDVYDTLVGDGLWDPYLHKHMGSCAERCAKEYDLKRDEQDRFAFQSYERAKKALENNYFKDETIALEIPGSKGKSTVCDTDEEPLAADLSKMAFLKPAFEDGGTITAANASKINDGAAAVVLASGKGLEDQSIKPLAKILAWSKWANEPELFASAPIGAIQEVVTRAGLNLAAIDHFEINEAFAVVPLAASKALGISESKINPFGGAIALGHPIGASGTRILVTLLHGLRRTQGRYGLATVCIGGGEALAVLIENLS